MDPLEGLLLLLGQVRGKVARCVVEQSAETIERIREIETDDMVHPTGGG